MELFVNLCYYLSAFVFCAGTVGFIVWDSSDLSRRSRGNAVTEQKEAPPRARQVAVMAAKEVPSRS
jgi:hypothetical protein